MHAKPLDYGVGHWVGQCVVVCGTCWFCIWSGVSYDWGPNLIREVSHCHDASFLLEFFFFAFFVSLLCLPEDYILIIKNLKVKCSTACPKH